MKIVMIGPVYPFKGGIAHYTGMMSKNLSNEHSVINISFKLQYPSFLYKKQQKDCSNTTFKPDTTYFTINTMNPISWLSTAKLINTLSPDLVIFQWWHPFFSPTYWSILALINKKFKTIFLCHNVLPHESFPLKSFLTKKVLVKADGYIVQSKIDAEDLKSIVAKPNYRLTVHPTYNAFKLNNISRDDARNQLQLTKDEPVLLFFGFIREYKGLKYLIRAMPSILSRLPRVRLLIVGDYFENNKNEYIELIKQVGAGEHIDLIDGYVPDNDVEKYFAACDLVVLPYESATQSGIVQIAYGFDKAVVATDVGGLPEVVINEKTGYIVPTMDESKLAEAVLRFLNENRALEFEENIRKEAYKYSWDRMTEIVTDLKESFK